MTMPATAPSPALRANARSDIRLGLMPTSREAKALSAHARTAAPGMVRAKKTNSAATTASDSTIAQIAWRMSTPPRSTTAGPGVNSGSGYGSAPQSIRAIPRNAMETPKVMMMRVRG